MPNHGEYADDIFNVLSNTRRRRVLELLRDADDGELTISNLSETIAAEENDKEARLLNAQERKRVYIGLYQCHLEMMHDKGFVDWDKDRGTVALAIEDTHEAFDHIDIANDDAAVDRGDGDGIISGWFGL